MIEAVGGESAPVMLDELVDLVHTRLGFEEQPEHVERRRNDFSTKLASEFVTLSFSGRPPLRLFVKRAVDAEGAHRPSPPDLEIRVYEALGSHPSFAAPLFIGAIGGDDPHLVLAATTGWDLRYQDVDQWELAARALGRMQTMFAGDQDRLEGCLPRQGEGHYLAQAALAAAVADAHPAAGAVLRPLVDGYGPIAAELAGQPLTLVHGDLAPKNVLIDTSDASERAVFVDWEWAAISCGALDLMDLVNGLDQDDRTRLVDAYVEEASGFALPADDGGIGRCLDLAQLQRTMFRIARSAAWQVPTEQVLAWTTEAAALRERLQGR